MSESPGQGPLVPRKGDALALLGAGQTLPACCCKASDGQDPRL